MWNTVPCNVNFTLRSIYGAVTIGQESISQMTIGLKSYSVKCCSLSYKFYFVFNLWCCDNWPRVNKPNDNWLKIYSIKYRALIHKFTLYSVYGAVTIGWKSMSQNTSGQDAMAYNARPCLINFTLLSIYGAATIGQESMRQMTIG